MRPSTRKPTINEVLNVEKRLPTEGKIFKNYLSVFGQGILLASPIVYDVL